MSVNQYDWVGFYKEFAHLLLSYKGNRSALIEKVKEVFIDTGINIPKLERDNKIVDMDPFTVFGLFNKTTMKETNRLSIISSLAERFGVRAAIPTSFDSIPVLNPLNATFYYFLGEREEQDIDNLWNLFETALNYAGISSAENRECKVLFKYDADPV